MHNTLFEKILPTVSIGPYIVDRSNNDLFPYAAKSDEEDDDNVAEIESETLLRESEIDFSDGNYLDFGVPSPPD